MKKTAWFIGGLLAVVLIATFVLSGTVTKGTLGKQDIRLWYSGTAAQTFSRTTSQGYSMTLNALDWVGIDVHQVYAGGTSRTGIIIATAASDVGYSTKRQMWLNPGTWTISTSLDISDYTDLYWYVPPGASISIATGVTLTLPSPSNIIAPNQQIFSGLGTVTFSKGGTVYPEWWGALADNSTACTTPIQSAADALMAGGTVQLGIGTYRITSIHLANAGTTLQGHGWNSILSTTNAITGNTSSTVLVQANNCTLRNFKTAWVTAPTALVEAGTWVTQNNGIGVGWYQVTGAQTLIENTLIDNVYVYEGKCHGICLGRTHNTTIVNSRVEAVYATGIWGTYACQVKIKGNYIYNTADAGIDMTANGADAYGPDDYSYNVVVEGNVLEDILIGIGLHGVYGGVANGNTIDRTWGAGILSSADAAGGHVAPSNIVITGNTIRRPWQYYAVGKGPADDYYATSGGLHAAIEAWVNDELVISNNTIYDNSSLVTGYMGIWAGGGLTVGAFTGRPAHLTISGNTLELDASYAIEIGSFANATAADQVDYFSMTGNSLVISSANGGIAVYLNGVKNGTVTGNIFDCGGQTLSTPQGRFLYINYAEDVVLTGNTVKNFTDGYTIVAGGVNLLSHGNNGIWGYCSNTATSVQLLDKTHAINTTNKTVGRPVWDTTLNIYVYAYGTTDISPWINEGSQVVHTPI